MGHITDSEPPQNTYIGMTGKQFPSFTDFKISVSQNIPPDSNFFDFSKFLVVA